MGFAQPFWLRTWPYLYNIVSKRKTYLIEKPMKTGEVSHFLVGGCFNLKGSFLNLFHLMYIVGRQSIALDMVFG